MFEEKFHKIFKSKETGKAYLQCMSGIRPIQLIMKSSYKLWERRILFLINQMKYIDKQLIKKKKKEKKSKETKTFKKKKHESNTKSKSDGADVRRLIIC